MLSIATVLQQSVRLLRVLEEEMRGTELEHRQTRTDGVNVGS